MNYKNIREVVENSKYKNEILQLLAKNPELNIDSIYDLINNYRIYCDYDEILSDLITPWIRYLNRVNNTNIQHSDVKSFFFFLEIPNGMDFLNQDDVYSSVAPTQEAIQFLRTLRDNDLLKNFFIITATYDKNIESKGKHIQEHFSEYIDHNHVITTKSKYVVDYTNGVLIDDGIHNVEAVVVKNPYARAVVLNYAHNEDLYTGKRISRISNLMDFFDLLPLLVLQSYDRFFDEEKRYLQKEHFFKKGV